MSTLAWFDGAVVPADQPLLSPLDRGFMVGDGVFDTCAVVDGQAFALTRHLDRLVRAAGAVGLTPPAPETIRGAVATLIAQAPPGPGRLRITLTPGPTSSRTDGAPTLVVTLAPEPGARPDGAPAATVVVVPWVRNERSPLVGVKSTSYAENVLALEYARARGGTEAVMGNTRGELCEGAASNVFLERDGTLLTPPLSSGCLGGVTRELVLEWGRAAGLPVEEATIPLAELATAPHVAITSSMRGIVPVRSVDGRALAGGEVTQQMAAVFAERFAQDKDP